MNFFTYSLLSIINMHKNTGKLTLRFGWMDGGSCLSEALRTEVMLCTWCQDWCGCVAVVCTLRDGF